MEGYFRHDIAKDREEKANLNYFHLLLLAKNEEGFHNLMRLSSTSYQDEYFYQKPCIDWRLLRKYSDNIICSSGCLSSLIPSEALRSDPDAIMRHLRVFRDIFGEDFYIEIQPHDIDDQRLVNLELINLANKEGIPLVAAGDVHYPLKDWATTQDILVMISTGQSKSKREREELEGKGYMKFSGDSFYLMDEDDIRSQFERNHQNIPSTLIDEAIRNTGVFASRCSHIRVEKTPKIPQATHSPLEAERILRQWTTEGLQRIGKENDQEYIDRLELELSIMKRMRVLDYFVIVGDAVRWAKEKGIRVGPGRGSAAGCLVNYLIGVTALDPIGYGLLFERFLNEYRSELPDIDIDFQDDRRDEVRNYLADKWGSSYVVDVASFQTFGFKAVIQDITRVLNVPFADAKKATDAIPDKTWGENLESLERVVPQLQQFFQQYPEVREHALRIHGQAKNQSKHAAAVIVTNEPADNLIPMMRSKDGKLVTQWTERANAQLISTHGFLKIDFLSTTGLTLQQLTIDLVEENRGETIDFEDNRRFPINVDSSFADKRVVHSFADGRLAGVFQCASPIMRSLFRELRPDTYNHIIAANALIRPGTARNEYVERKHGKQYHVHDSLHGILDETYGIPIYQEQIIAIVRALGKDITSEDAAVILKIVSKGIARDKEGRKKLKTYEDKFKEGCLDKGISTRDTNAIWKQITDLGEYVFNKAHATGYALQAYQDKWLKVNYPLEFYTALLTLEPGKTALILREMRGTNIAILPPDINYSERGFSITDNSSIRFGLRAIKGLGSVTIDHILEHRPFDSFEDMIERMPTNKLTKTRKESLLGAGAFDCWGGRSKWVLNDDCSDRIPGAWTQEDRAVIEKELLGLPLSQLSEVDKYRSLLEAYIVPADDLEQMNDREVIVGGEIVGIKEHKTRNGGVMVFLDLEFDDNQYNLTVWPRKYDDYYSIIKPGNVVLAMGDWDKQRQNIVLDTLVKASQMASENGNRP